jgi:hypothetical protein
LFYRYYKKLRSDDLFDFAFKKDAVMIKAAENALTTFMDSPLQFGAVCIEAREKVWRLTRPWPRLLADHINAIITNPGPTSKDDISDALDLVVLLSNKLAFVNYHKRNLAKRILSPVLCIELENVAISRLRTVCDHYLWAKCETLLADHDTSRRFSDEFSRSNEIEMHMPALAPVDDFDIRYLSKRTWQECKVWSELPVRYSSVPPYELL